MKNTKRVKSKKNKKKEWLNEDYWLYILLLTTLMILITSLKSYTFKFLSVNITYSILLLPLAYLLANFITKRYGYHKTIVSISASSIGIVIFNLLMSYITSYDVAIIELCSQFCGYLISQLINLTIYYFLLQNTNQPYILTLLTYIFSILTFYMFYTLININLLIYDDYWTCYFSTVGIQSILCCGIAYVDKRIKRGEEKEEL